MRRYIASPGEDPTIRLSTDPDTGQTMIAGMGELHLDMVREKLEMTVNSEIRFGRPEVSYRETIQDATNVTHLHKKQTGGSGQYAKVSIRFEPLPRGSGFEFVDEIKGAAIDKEHIPAVRKGIEKKAMNGPVRGCQLVDFKATLYDGDKHENDSSHLAFELAGAEALAIAMETARPVLLEPIMAVTVNCSEENSGRCHR